MSGIVGAVHQSSSKLGDTPLVRLDLFTTQVFWRAFFQKGQWVSSSPSRGQGRVQRSPPRSPDRFEARAATVLAMHRLLLYALAAMNGDPSRPTQWCKRTTYHLFPMLCVAASWPSTHQAGRSTAPARGVRRWMPSCCCATFETASRCQRWQSSGRLNPPPNEAKMQSSGDGQMFSRSSTLSTTSD